MTTSSSLSVVVATTGRASWRRCVDSVLRSADAAPGADVEVLLVWQSEDEPPEVPRVRVLDVFPVSLSYARNRGLAGSRGDLVAFLDDDEVAVEAYVLNLLRAFAERPDAAGVFGAVSPLDDEGVPYCVVTADQRTEFRGRRAPWRVGTGGNMAFRRDLLAGAGGFDLQLGVATPGLAGEDTDIVVRLLRAGRVLLLDPDIEVQHPTKTPGEVLASRRPYGFGTGRVARRNRDAKVAAQYASSLGQAFWAAARDRSATRWHETWLTLRGFLGGLLGPTRWVAPLPALRRMPETVAAELGAPLSPLPVRFQGGPSFQYQAPGRLLHLHVHPGADPLGRAAQDHADGYRSPGTPRARVVVPGRDALWVVTDEATRPPRGSGRLRRRPVTLPVDAGPGRPSAGRS